MNTLNSTTKLNQYRQSSIFTPQLEICKQVSIALRDYQQALIRLVYEKWDKGLLKILMQLPTGGGKTIILAATEGRVA